MVMKFACALHTVIWFSVLSSTSVYAQDESRSDLFDLSLHQLMNLEVQSSSTFTPTKTSQEPASITHINQSMIRKSGARSVLDLLEMYVPNMHYLPHHWEPRHIGIRGIIGDREDKYLLLVNGKVMNEQTHLGAMSERDLPMLGDIRRIEVIRGPGSVVHGPGAISSVINIHTESAQYNDGAALIVKAGAVDEFQSIEIKDSFNFGQDHGLYAYAGFSDVQGASNKDAPTVYGLSGTTTWGDSVVAGQDNLLINNPNYNAAHGSDLKIKLHFDYQFKNWQTWLRLTQGGEKMSWSHKIFFEDPNGFADAGNQQESLSQHSVGYRQITAQTQHEHVIDAETQVNTTVSWASTDAQRILFDSFSAGKLPENHREEKWFLSSVFNTRPDKNHSFALGAELNYETYGLSSEAFSAAAPNSFVLGEMQQWSTYSAAIYSEHQWQISQQINQFIGARLDKDQYTGYMWSPRLAWVYALDNRQTVKTIISRSVRKNNAEELRKLHTEGGQESPEVIESLELSYQNQLSKGHRISGTVFYNQYEVLAINVDTLRSDAVADMNFGGIELEWSYHTDNWQIDASHGFTKLMKISGEDATKQKISANLSGYGNDISQWSDHISKLVVNHNVTENLSVNSSLRLFWGYEGSQDYIDLTYDLRQESSDSSSTALTSTANYDDPTGMSAFLDAGIQYDLSKNSALGFHGYNLLGLVDEKLNKRIYVINVGNYQLEPTSFSLQYRYNF
jgi:iron complex outermembrane receptor protein